MAIIPLAQISKLLALQRCAVFTSLKNPALQALTGSAESTYINYNPLAFKDLLEKISVDKYDGVRVYFANYKKDSTNDPEGSAYIPDGQDKKFALIFVPTTTSVQDDATIHVDDTNNCLIIDKTGVVRKLSTKTASAWITEYQQYKRPFFRQDGVNMTATPDFQEAICVWYDNNLIRRNGTNGMLDYIDELINDETNPLEFVTALFAGYLNGENTIVNEIYYSCEYILTIVFYFKQLNSAAINSAAKNNFNLPESETSTNFLDTGNPCPPPKTGCSGTNLPS